MNTGTRSASAARRSASSARPNQTSPPTTNAGRSAPATSAATAATASGSGSTGSGAANSMAARAGEKIVSIGTSTNTGPRCGVSAARAASSSTGPISSPVAAVRDSFVTGARIGTWSSSCRPPRPQLTVGARPPSTTSGTPVK